MERVGIAVVGRCQVGAFATSPRRTQNRCRIDMGAVGMPQRAGRPDPAQCFFRLGVVEGPGRDRSGALVVRDRTRIVEVLEGLRGVPGTVEAAVGAALLQALQLGWRQGRRRGQGLACGQAQAEQGGQRPGASIAVLHSSYTLQGGPLCAARRSSWLPTQLLRRAGNRGRVDAMSIRLTTAVNNNRNNLRANNRARPMRDCALGR
ncbi:hypothetical protein G6F57_013816 [Rhizopus arrhizus]|nr:hypothetical protein G6F65_017976 [Rhizopus arrhizus]KAG1463095.1 hypothetical protein G6F57_013816 [Rhizopus arrhizus]